MAVATIWVEPDGGAVAAAETAPVDWTWLGWEAAATEATAVGTTVASTPEPAVGATRATTKAATKKSAMDWTCFLAGAGETEEEWR